MKKNKEKMKKTKKKKEKNAKKKKKSDPREEGGGGAGKPKPQTCYLVTPQTQPSPPFNFWFFVLFKKINVFLYFSIS